MNGFIGAVKGFQSLGVLFVVIFGCVGCKTYSPMPEAEAAMLGDSTVGVVEHAGYIQFLPTNPSGQGFIFYPGASVDPEAYAPMVLSLAQQGVTAVIAKFPLNLAVLSPNRADAIRQALPNITQWWLSGHSLGGVMATQYRVDNETDAELAGLILLAAYPQASDDLSDSSIPVLSIFATEDQLTKVATIEQTKPLLPSMATYYEIIGGNHAQFGWYGAQDGDGQAFISREQQQSLVVEQIVDFLAI